jgi:hypothetical protein
VEVNREGDAPSNFGAEPPTDSRKLPSNGVYDVGVAILRFSISRIDYRV